MKTLISCAYRAFTCIGNSLQSPFLLAIRLYWGWQFFMSGRGKLTGLDKVTEFFRSLGIPFPALNAFAAGSAECFGGLLLLVGLGSRPVALVLTFTMLVAYVTADLDAVKAIFSEPDKFVAAAPFPFLFAVLVVLAFGPGLFSVDAWLDRWFSSKEQQTAQPGAR